MSDETGEREVELLRYLHGEMSPEERTRFEGEVVREPELAEALYVQQSLADWTRAAESRAPGSTRVAGRLPWYGRRSYWTTAAAAVLVVAVGAVTLMQRDRGERERFRAGAESILVAPRGELPAPPTEFRWRAVKGAANYRFELTDAASGARFRVIVPDTVLSLERHPDAGTPAEGSWRVVPLAANGAELPAPTPIFFETR